MDGQAHVKRRGSIPEAAARHSHTPLMTLTTDLGLSIRVSMFKHVDW